jgi:hypothetical protein
MAYDKGLAQITRADLCDVIGISEKKMFAGIAFMYAGHMVCGIHKDGAMFRVGKNQEAEAKAIEGAGAMMFTGRKMGGLIDAFVDDERRALWMGMSLRHAQSLPPKS